MFVDDLSDAQRRMLTLADNQTTLMTGWDFAELESELDALADSFNVSDFGFEFEKGGEEPLGMDSDNDDAPSCAANRCPRCGFEY